MSIRSLVVKVGAETQALDQAFTRIGSQARKAEADLRKIGTAPLGSGAQKSLADLESAMAAVTRGQERIAERARLAAVGLEQIGGAARLTRGQLAEMQRTIEGGLDAYRALGQQAPKDLQRVASAITQQQRALEGAGKSTTAFSGAQSVLLSRVVALAGPAALGAAVSQALDYADSLTKLSDRTGIGTTQLQRLAAVATASGNSIEEISDAVNRFQKSLVSGAADDTIRSLGLSVAALRQQAPDEQFFAIARAIQGIPDPAQQAAAAMELFGRSGAQLLPTLKADVDALADSTIQMSAEAIKTLDAAGDAWGRFKTSALNTVGEVAAAVVELGASIATIPSKMAAAVRGTGAPTPFATAVPGMLVGGAVSEELQRSLTPQQLAALVRGEGVMLPKRPTLATGAPGGPLGIPSAEEEKAFVAQIEREIAARNEAGKAARDHAQALAAVQAKIAEALQPVVTLTDRQKDLAVTYRELGLSSREIALALGVSRTSVEAYTDGLDASFAAIEHNREATGKFQQDLGKLATGFDKAGKVSIGFRGVMQTLPLLEARTNTNGLAQSFANLTATTPRTTTGVEAYRAELERAAAASASMGRTLSDLSTAFHQIASVSGGAFGGIVQDVARIVTALDLATKAATAFKQAQSTGERAAALASGAAAVAQATGSGSQRSRVAGGAITGASIGSVFPGVGTAIGAGVGALIGYFRGQSAEKTVNRIREAFVQTEGGLHRLNLRAQAAGVTLDHLLDARTPEQYTRALEELNDALAFQESAMETLQATVEKYGFTLDELGPAFRRQELDKQAQSLFKDFQLLTSAGIDQRVVLEKMSAGINDYVRNARRFGTEVPAAMRPMLQRMIELGLLTDENGVAFTSLEEAGVTFAETMSEGFTRVVDEVKRLTDAIARGLGIALDGLPRQIEIDVAVRRRGSGREAPPERSEPSLPASADAALGGRVLPFVRADVGRFAASTFSPIVGTSPARLASGLGGGGGPAVVVQAEGYIDSPWAQRRLGQLLDRELSRRVRVGHRVGAL